MNEKELAYIRLYLEKFCIQLKMRLDYRKNTKVPCIQNIPK